MSHIYWSAMTIIFITYETITFTGLRIYFMYTFVVIGKYITSKEIHLNQTSLTNYIHQVCGDTDRTIKYSVLRDHCAALAVRLQRPEFGLKPHDVIALCLPNSPDFAIASLGALEAGLSLTTINPIYTAGKNPIALKYA